MTVVSTLPAFWTLSQVSKPLLPRMISGRLTLVEPAVRPVAEPAYAPPIAEQVHDRRDRLVGADDRRAVEASGDDRNREVGLAATGRDRVILSNRQTRHSTEL